MAIVNTINGDLRIVGGIQATDAAATSLPAGCVGDTQVSSVTGNAITAAKLQHQHKLIYFQADGTDAAAAIVPLYIARGTGTLDAVEVACIDAPSGGDKKFTVDVWKSTTGTPSPTSMLSAAVDYANGTADATVLTGTITTTAIADADVLGVTVAVSGSTGAQGQGVAVTLTIREAY
jgi:hypothetical protein